MSLTPSLLSQESFNGWLSRRSRDGLSGHASRFAGSNRNEGSFQQYEHSLEAEEPNLTASHRHNLYSRRSSTKAPWSSTPTAFAHGQRRVGSSQNDPSNVRVLAGHDAASRFSTEDEQDLLMERLERLLVPTDAPEDDLAYYSSKRVESSCEWVFEQRAMHDFWEDTELRPQLLWCYGVPGSGKSVIATHIIEELINASKPCGYYYFRSGHQADNALSSFLTTVAFQLAKHLSQYRHKLCALADHRFDVSKAGHKLLWKKLFGTGLFECGIKESVYLVLDGLDELSQTRELLQRMFLELEGVVCPIRILLVSRSTTEIETAIDKLSRKPITVQRMPLDCNPGDLGLYVRDELSSMLGDDQFKLRTMNELLKKANGNFLWANLVVEELLNCRTESQAENALRQVPKELTPLYERMDQRLAETFRSRPQDQRMGILIMMWVVCAQRPLHLDELRGMLEYEFPRILDMRQTVRSVCGEFVVVSRDGIVAMVHASAQEFLTMSPHLNYHIDRPTSHHDLFLKCLQALDKARGLEALPDYEEAFVEYAASYWPFHLIHSDKCDDQRSFAALSSLFKSHSCLRWISMLARAKNLRSMIEASKAIGRLLKALDKADQDLSPLLHKLEEKDTLRQWSQDLIQIVGQFGPAIMQRPTSVHRILPAFCPQDSMLRKRFAVRHSSRGIHEPSSIRVRGKMSPFWGDCFAKLSVARRNWSEMPHRVVPVGRYFAILSELAGAVHLYHSSTCDLARSLQHNEPILTYCTNTSLDRIATNGSRKTTVWNIEDGRIPFSVENPSRLIKALTMAFQRDYYGNESLVTYSEDGLLRACCLQPPLNAPSADWKLCGPRLGSSGTQGVQASSPHNATFSPDGCYLAISYRGEHPAVWYVGPKKPPRLLGQCDHRAPHRSTSQVQKFTSYVYATTFSWNPATNHLLGAYMDGAVFRWHPEEHSDFRLCTEPACTEVKCSADGTVFATASLDGTLRVWNFEHFTPIYTLRYPGTITDLDIDANEARVYDLRDQYCNIWQPSSLLKSLESDTRGDGSSSAGSDHPSQAPEAVQEEDFELIAALAVSNEPLLYAFGGNTGTVRVADLDGNVIHELQSRSTSRKGVQKLLWSQTSNRVVSIDAGRKVTVWQLPSGTRREATASAAVAKVVRTFAEGDTIIQALFSRSDQSVMIVTPVAIKIYQIMENTPPTVLPCDPPSRWLVHPHNDRHAVGLSAQGATLLSRDEASDLTSISYRAVSNPIDISEKLQMLALTPQRSSQVSPLNPPDNVATVDRLYTSPDGNLVLMEVYGTSKHSRHRIECLLVGTDGLNTSMHSTSVPVASAPASFMEALYKCLGFVEHDTLAGDHPVWSPTEHSGPHARDLYTFCFVDKDFWVCSAVLGFAQEQKTRIAKHFFLPRDWQNSEWLDMATVTTRGDFVCPRNGKVAVVSDWLGESFVE